MTSGLGKQISRRIIIGFKPAQDVDQSVQAATTLASAIDAEIVGLYVREETMIDLAGLPFSCALDVGTARSVPLSQGAMEQAFKTGAVTCRHTLSVMAGKAQVKWSFNTGQGELADETEKVAISGDFLMFDCAGREFGMRFPVEMLRTIPSYVSGAVIAARRRMPRRRGPVIAIVDGGDAAGRQAVVLAAHLAKAAGVTLELFIISASNAEAQRIIQRAKDLIDPDLALHFHRFMPGVLLDIASAFSHFSPSFIVAGLNGEPFNDDASAQMLFRAASAPIVLLQRGDEGSQL